MAYDRNEGRRGWREPRGSFDNGNRYEDRESRPGWGREDDNGERGFFERARDEVSSWFSDEEPNRDREDRRFGNDDGWRRSGSFGGNEDASRYDRQARFRDEGYRRPYTGRFSGQQDRGGESRYRPMAGDYGRSSDQDRVERQRDFTGMAASGGLHDPHYSEWRRRQLDELDRDYDDYRRENQSRFESDFSNWRTSRQGKRQLLGQVREQMTVVGSDEEHVGTVDHVRSDRIILSKGDSEDGKHHVLSCSLVDRVEGDKVILDQPAAEVKQRLDSEIRDRGMFRDDDDREGGPHMLNRAFSGTYER